MEGVGSVSFDQVPPLVWEFLAFLLFLGPFDSLSGTQHDF